MGFTNQERINVASKALQAGVIDGNPESVWYETFFPFTFILSSEQVWTEMTTLRGLPAGNLADARANAGANPTLIQDLSQNADAVQLTLVAGTNFSTYVSRTVPGDASSDQMKNWLI